MSIEAAFRTVLALTFAAGALAGAGVYAVVRWARERREPVRVVTITMEPGGGCFTWEATYDMQAVPFAVGVEKTWRDARLQGLHAVVPDIDVIVDGER